MSVRHPYGAADSVRDGRRRDRRRDATPAEDRAARRARRDGLRPPRARRRRWLRWVGARRDLLVLVAAAAGAGWWLYQQLDGNITHRHRHRGTSCERYEKERPAPPAQRRAEHPAHRLRQPRRRQQQVRPGRAAPSARTPRSCCTSPADRRSATAVSHPARPDGRTSRPADGRTAAATGAQFAQFNWAFQFGGAACTIRTVEKLTGIRVDHHMVVDFTRLQGAWSTRSDGVEVCLHGAVDDKDAQLRAARRAGRRWTASRRSATCAPATAIGNGSDTERMDRQQQFLGSLVKKVQSNGVLLNPAKLYPGAGRGDLSLTTDPGLARCSELYDLVRGLRDIPTRTGAIPDRSAAAVRPRPEP